MKSPFKFLDSYTLADRASFFGRRTETDKLYNMIFESPLVMIYGLSGTGKTSLVQCGLASRFDGPDWFPFYIRREKDINQSLHDALNFHLEDYETALSLIGKVSYLYGEYLSPVYLIFDQFEELFILGTKAEQDQFIQNLKELLDARLACRVILVMREEYLGHLYDFERVIPYIFDFRLRIEEMNRTKVKEVMLSSFDRFNIQLEEPTEELTKLMFENISGKKAGIPLPYLQVYLDLLYRQTYAADQNLSANVVLPPLTFTKEQVNKLGKMEDVLERFVQEQTLDLQSGLLEKYPTVKKGSVKKVLDAFVTEEGTKRPVHYLRKGAAIQVDSSFKELVSFLPPEVLSHCIAGLEKRRILRFTDSSIELAHDSIATLIDQNRTEQQRQVNQIIRRIKNSYIEYRDNEVYLTEKQLNVYEEFLPIIDLEDDIELFIDRSREHIAREKRTAIRKKLFPLVTTLGVIAVIAGAFAIWNLFQVIEERKKATRKTIEVDITSGISLKNQGNYQSGIKRLAIAKQAIRENNLQQELKDTLQWIEQLQLNYAKIDRLMAEGDSLLSLSDMADTLKLVALERYQQALEIEPDSLIALKRSNLETVIPQRADEWYNRAQIYTQFAQDQQANSLAVEALEYAIKLDSSRSGKIDTIRQLMNEKGIVWVMDE